MDDVRYEITYFYEGDVYTDLVMTSDILKTIALNFFAHHPFIKQCLIQHGDAVMYISFIGNKLEYMFLSEKVETGLDFLKYINVVVKNEEEVFKYLMQYPNIKSTLVDRINVVIKEFPENKVYLERYFDPEEGYTNLNIVVMGDKFSGEFVNRVEGVNYSFLDELPQIYGRVNIVAEFEDEKGENNE